MQFLTHTSLLISDIVNFIIIARVTGISSLKSHQYHQEKCVQAKIAEIHRITNKIPETLFSLQIIWYNCLYTRKKHEF